MLIMSVDDQKVDWLANHEEYAPGGRKEEKFTHQMHADAKMFDQDALLVSCKGIWLNQGFLVWWRCNGMLLQLPVD